MVLFLLKFVLMDTSDADGILFAPDTESTSFLQVNLIFLHLNFWQIPPITNSTNLVKCFDEVAYLRLILREWHLANTCSLHTNEPYHHTA